MSDEPFGRQPQPVKVTLTGDYRDVYYWAGILARYAEFKGDTTSFTNADTFTIYPRANNE